MSLRRDVNRGRLLLGVLAAVVLLVVGCSDSDSDSGSGGSDGSSATASSTSSETSTSSTPTSTSSTPTSTADSGAVSTTAAAPSTSTTVAVSAATCSAAQLLAVPTVAGSGPWADIELGKCRGGYAHAWTVPEARNLESEQWFFVVEDGGWVVVTFGTGVDCADTADFSELADACRALQMDAPPAGVTADAVAGWAERSGCTPGTDALPDGTWFGYIGYLEDGKIGFDLACWFSTYAEEAAALEDGEVTNGYWIRNDNPLVRQLPVADDAVVRLVDLDAPDGFAAPIGADDWLDLGGPQASVYAYWIATHDGEVVRISEAYQP